LDSLCICFGAVLAAKPKKAAVFGLSSCHSCQNLVGFFLLKREALFLHFVLQGEISGGQLAKINID